MRASRIRARAKVTLLAAALSAAALACPASQDVPPRLVLLLVVDQLRSDRVGAELPGGLGRLAREGRAYVDAVLEHAPTDTCSGHATVLSGRHPGAMGVPGNLFVVRESGRVRYCVEDEAPDARTLGGEEGRSPRLLRATTLGDWLKEAHPEARVFALAGKDRAAVALGGKRPDGVYWLASQSPPRFTTSGYYASQLPAWLRRFNGVAAAEGFLARLPEHWVHADGSRPNGARRDDYPFEEALFHRTSGHPVRWIPPPPLLAAFAYTPYLDQVTLELARLLIEGEQLGRDAVPDLLALSLSATDRVGHLYGPASQEALDALQRLDATLGEFLDWLEGWVGRERLIVVLTADHGVMPLPEWLAETGRSECPVEGGRVAAAELVRGLAEVLVARFGEPADPEAPWMLQAHFQLTVNRPLAVARGIDPASVAAEAKRFLETQPGVARVWTRQEMAAAQGPSPFAAFYRNSFDSERSGDLAIQPARDCLITLREAGTDHGSPYLYDRAVPLIFRGPGIEAGRIRGRARPVDIAPTLAALLGVAPPAGLDGRRLELGPDSAGHSAL